MADAPADQRVRGVGNIGPAAHPLDIHRSGRLRRGILQGERGNAGGSDKGDGGDSLGGDTHGAILLLGWDS